MRLKTLYVALFGGYVGLLGGGAQLWKIAVRSEVDLWLGFPSTLVFLGARSSAKDHSEPKIRALVVPRGDKSRTKLGVSVTSMT